MNVNDTIAVAYKDVQTFNTLAGNLKDVKLRSIDAQLGFIFEEFTETVDGLEAGDYVELLDGTCDLFVTVAGLMQKLEAAGFNVAAALDRVNANNLSKFPKDVTAEDIAAYNVTLNTEYGRYVLKDTNGKVRKPSTFVPVDVSEFAPKEVQE